tara:strand:+ start:1542 stop:1748 length:207 start_codon:yes stop_codon:yes gene_type:complete
MITIKHNENGVDYLIGLESTGEVLEEVSIHDRQEAAEGVDQYGNTWDGCINISCEEEINGSVLGMVKD